MKNWPEIDDLALLRQIQHGDEAAMEEFYRRFAPGLHSFIHCRVREPDDIEDILAETMTGAVTAIMRFKGQSRVFTWLCRIAREFTQAMMELGVLICLPRKPGCKECPVQDECRARQNNPESFPVKQAVRAIPSERRIVLRIDWNEKRLLVQRPDSGLLAGFWEYPNLRVQTGVDALAFARQWAGEHLGLPLSFAPLTTITQVFTHRRWELEILTTRWPADIAPRDLPSSQWVLPGEEMELPRVAYLRQLDGDPSAKLHQL